MRLIESERARERRRGGAVLSVVAHGALIALAIAATTRTGRTTEIGEPLVDVIYRAPLPSPPQETPGRRADGRTSTSADPVNPLPPRRLDVPITIRDGIPDVDVDLGPITGTLVVGLGPAHRSGGGEPGATGAPGGDGVWSAHVVEVAAAPQPGNPVPAYPELLRTAGTTGEVVAEFVVDSSGLVRVGSLRIVASTHELFAVSVRRTVPAMRFLPARVEGRAVAQRVRMPFVFEVR